MIKIVAVTDIHNNVKDLEKLVDRVISKTEDFPLVRAGKNDHTFDHSDLNLFVITGDIQDDPGDKVDSVPVTDHVNEDMIRLDEAGFMCFVVPGNHDVGKKGIFYSEAAKDHFCKQFDTHVFPYHYEFPAYDFCLIGVDSTAGADDTILAAGEIGKAQLEELDRILSETQCKHKVVLMHHHPVKRTSHSDSVGMELVDSEEYRRIATKWGVTLTIHGHRHSYQGQYKKEGILTFTPGKLKGDRFSVVEIRDNGRVFSTLGV